MCSEKYRFSIKYRFFKSLISEFGNSTRQICDEIPHHPYSDWDCQWSASMKIKSCRKSCIENFELSSGPIQLKCHVKNGWLVKEMARCELEASKSCEIDNYSNEIKQLPIELIKCSK